MKRYYPGKYFLNILKQARDAIIHWGHWGQHNAVSAEQQAKMFIYILQNLPKINLEKVKIIVIANEKFILALKKEINSRLYPPYIKGIIPLNIFINPMCKKNYYILDDHMNLRGHQIYAERIIQIIERNK
jgi:hypothetical protein